jgi:hypothetical protein
MLSAARPTHAMPASVRARLLRRIGDPPPRSGIPAAKLFVIASAIGALSLPVASVLLGTQTPSVRPPVAPVRSAVNPVREELSPPGEAAVPPDALRTPPQTPQASAPARPPTVRPPPAARPLSPESPAATSPREALGDTLAREVELLEQARARFDADPASALALLDEHARVFPAGKLAIERELLALDALERIGKTADARSRAERALGSARGTIYEARIRSHLATSREAPF